MLGMNTYVQYYAFFICGLPYIVYEVPTFVLGDVHVQMQLISSGLVPNFTLNVLYSLPLLSRSVKGQVIHQTCGPLLPYQLTVLARKCTKWKHWHLHLCE